MGRHEGFCCYGLEKGEVRCQAWGWGSRRREGRCMGEAEKLTLGYGEFRLPARRGW